MLKTTMESLRKAPGHVITVQKSKKLKRPAKAKKPAKSETFRKASKAKKKKVVPSTCDVCWQCNASGHWSINFEKCLEEKKKMLLCVLILLKLILQLDLMMHGYLILV
jgi:hypothetical protein